MKYLLFKKLYAKQELQHKIEDYKEKYEQFQAKNDYPSIASACYNLGRLYEILGDREKSQLYYQKVVDEWNIHPHKIADHLCVNALRALNSPKKALDVVLMNPKKWMLSLLANLYEEMGRKKEAQLIYAGLSHYSYQLSEVRYSFWRPHYLQKGVDFCKKAGLSERARIYSQRAVEAWEEMRDNMRKSLRPIEEAWLYEEIGYIFEKNEKLKMAIEYFREAEAKYKHVYTKGPASAATHHATCDWDDYLGFFVHQIPDFRLIYFHSDSPEENDYRRMKYRILNVRECMKETAD